MVKRLIIILFAASMSFGGPIYAAPAPIYAHAVQAEFNKAFDERLFDAKLSAVQDKIDAMEKAIVAMMESNERAITIKTQEMDRRLEGLKELRGDVVRDRVQFVRKDVYLLKVKEYDEAVRRLANLESRLIAWGSAFVVFFALINIGIQFWVTRNGRGWVG